MNDLKGIIEDCNKSDLVSDKIIQKIIEIIGQGEWQDLHDKNNDICTTMGELIITLKGVADLEQENKTISRKANEAIADKLLITAKYNEVLNDLNHLNQENDKLKKENAELDCQKNRNKFCYSCANATEKCFKNEIGCPCNKYKSYKDENAELKGKAGLSIDCEKAQKDGELCLGYGGNEDEPCEQCKNCIKCECGYYQLGETEKDEQLTKAKEIIKKLKALYFSPVVTKDDVKRQDEILEQAEQFLKDI